MTTTIRHAGRRGTRIIDGIPLTITEQIWVDQDHRRDSHWYTVERADTGRDLTADIGLDAWPTDTQLLRLLDDDRGRWRCPGCATTVDVHEHDLVDDHLRDCPTVRGSSTSARTGRL